MITSIAPPLPLPSDAELLRDESENIKSSPKFTVPNVYPAPAELIVVSVPAVKPKSANAPPETVARTIAPEDVP